LTKNIGGVSRHRETSLLVNTSGIPAAAENPQCIRTDRDVRGFMQQRCFCKAKTRRQQMYTDVRLLTMYLHRLFPKALEIRHILVSTRSICQNAGVPAVLH